MQPTAHAHQRSLFFFGTAHNVSITASHIPGTLNSSADTLSRNNLALFFSLNPQATPSPTPLDQAVRLYFDQSIAQSTRASYNSAYRRYRSFYSSLNISPLSATEHSLCQFVTMLAQDGLRHHSMKCYLAQSTLLTLHTGMGMSAAQQL